MIIYFSGTGNSRYCAQLIGERLEDEVVDAALYIKKGVPADLTSLKPWVFVAPTYAWRLPRIFVDFIRAARFSGQRRAWFVMTCGGHIGAAGERIAPLCREKDLLYMGVLQVIMPENYIALYDAPGQAEAAEIMALARPVLEAGVEHISRGEAFPRRKGNPLQQLQTALVNPIFYRVVVKADPFRVAPTCTGCGKCVKACPLNNIALSQGRPAWGHACTHCMACICGCPVEAIEYGKASVGRYRYWCGEYRP